MAEQIMVKVSIPSDVYLGMETWGDYSQDLWDLASDCDSRGVSTQTVRDCLTRAGLTKTGDFLIKDDSDGDPGLNGELWEKVAEIPVLPPLPQIMVKVEVGSDRYLGMQSWGPYFAPLWDIASDCDSHDFLGGPAQRVRDCLTQAGLVKIGDNMVKSDQDGDPAINGELWQ